MKSWEKILLITLLLEVNILFTICGYAANSASRPISQKPHPGSNSAGLLPPPATTIARSERPLAFRDWKQQQIEEARATLEKATNPGKLSGDPTTESLSPSEIPTSNRVKFAASNLPGNERQAPRKGALLRAAYEGLQYAHDLGLDDYVSVYLPNFRNDLSSLRDLMGRLSDQESAELTQALMKERERQSAVGSYSSPLTSMADSHHGLAEERK
ncbi:MAG: hypothetical protein IPJ71_09625 [Bdellovibrionales bacterium]|nr:hypothetical protein [Bdellovibrionales bacterium]